jgi:hypothetical protein
MVHLDLVSCREMFAQASATARHSLRQCVIANTDDMKGSEQLVAHYFPWLSDALRANTVPRDNTRESQKHPTVVLPDGE